MLSLPSWLTAVPLRWKRAPVHRQHPPAIEAAGAASMRGTCATQHFHLPVLLEVAQSAPCQLRMLQDRVGWCELNLIVRVVLICAAI